MTTVYCSLPSIPPFFFLLLLSPSHLPPSVYCDKSKVRYILNNILFSFLIFSRGGTAANQQVSPLKIIYNSSVTYSVFCLQLISQLKSNLKPTHAISLQTLKLPWNPQSWTIFLPVSISMISFSLISNLNYSCVSDSCIPICTASAKLHLLTHYAITVLSGH